MIEEWNLPPDEKFRYTGDNCLELLLDSVTKEVRNLILLLFWRCWNLRDDCIHSEGKESIGSSVNFLKR